MKQYVIDTETGGFKCAEHALLSLAIIELDVNHVPLRELEVFFLPTRVVTDEAAAVNGYTPEKWAERGAVPLKEGMERIATWMDHPPFDRQQAIAHNASFDNRFVKQAMADTSIELPLHPIWSCSLEKFRDVCRKRRWFPPNHKLDSLAHMCGHWAPGYVRGDHGALADTRACAAGWKWLHDQYAVAVPFGAALPPSMGAKP